MGVMVNVMEFQTRIGQAALIRIVIAVNEYDELEGNYLFTRDSHVHCEE